MRFLFVFLFICCNSYAEIVTISCTFKNEMEEMAFSGYANQPIYMDRKINGLQYSVFIKNSNTLNSLEDYISIRNSSGHEITYQLNCRKIF
jgi:homoserine acetyltransferase